MKVSTKGRYALRMMIDLAEHNTGEYISLKEISKRQSISMKYLEQIIILLSRAGFVKSVRGPQGGYQLTKPADQYTVGSILRITEGSLAPVACLEDSENLCPHREDCSTIELWEQLYQAITNVVDHITLEELVENNRKKQGYDFSI